MPDLREIIKNKQELVKLPHNHKKRFEKKLQNLHAAKRYAPFFLLKLAASVLILIGLAYTFWPETTPVNEIENYDIATVSPELKEIENKYVAAINFEMLGIVPTKENKALIDTYLKKVAELEKEYKRLSIDLINKEVKEEIIEALIENLQIRLRLLVELKDNLKALKINKNSKNETTII
ncbi:hypothetical protein MWU59_06255 [Flavobacteriaceae bacterium F08102]|nr:hypothetical protein [Flavobacteriaceae bacterium F08102]